MSDRQDLSGLLEQLTSEGLLDSKGLFTLDSKRAWEKARGLRLADPEQYLRCLYRGAVLGEATRIELLVDSNDTILSFDGPALTASQMLYLLSSLYVEEPSWCARKLQQLALGLQGGWGQGFIWAEIHSPEAAVRYYPDRPEPEQIKPDRPSSENRIHFRRPFGTRVVTRYLTKNFSEASALSNLGWSNTSVIYNGQELARNRCRQGQFRFDNGLPRSLCLANWEDSRKLEMPDCDREMSLLFDLLPERPRGSFNLLVADVQVPSLYEIPDCPGLSATLAVGPMLLDASQTHPVENDDFRSLVDWVKRAWALGVVTANRHRKGREEYQALLQSVPPDDPCYAEAESLLLTQDPPDRLQQHRGASSQRQITRWEVDFSGWAREGETLHIPFPPSSGDGVLLLRESRQLKVVRQEQTVESLPLSKLLEVVHWESQGRIFLRLDFGLREIDLYQELGLENANQLRSSLRDLARACRPRS